MPFIIKTVVARGAQLVSASYNLNSSIYFCSLPKTRKTRRKISKKRKGIQAQKVWSVSQETRDKWSNKKEKENDGQKIPTNDSL